MLSYVRYILSLRAAPDHLIQVSHSPPSTTHIPFSRPPEPKPKSRTHALSLSLAALKEDLSRFFFSDRRTSRAYVYGTHAQQVRRGTTELIKLISEQGGAHTPTGTLFSAGQIGHPESVSVLLPVRIPKAQLIFWEGKGTPPPFSRPPLLRPGFSPGGDGAIRPQTGSRRNERAVAEGGRITKMRGTIMMAFLLLCPFSFFLAAAALPN